MALSSPTSLQRKYSLDGHEIEYRGIMELCQGGSEVGDLFIDGRRVGGDARFGGPLLLHAGVIYIPLFTKSFLFSGFTLARVDLGSDKVCLIGERKGVIYLDKVESGIVYYYTDIERTRREELSLEGERSERAANEI